MRPLDDELIDPQIAAELDAIDATLAGEPVDPRHAELAELALLVAAQRPQIDPVFARSLDERLARRFAGAGAAGRGADRPPGARSRGGSGGLAAWLTWKAGLGGLVTAAGAIAVAIVIAGSSGAGANRSVTLDAVSPSHTSSTAGPSASAPESATAKRSAVTPSAGTPQPAAGSTSSGSATSSAPDAASASGGVASAPAPQPPSNGRKIIQGAQLALSTAPNRVEDVAQSVFNVIGYEHGVVRHSTVTATGAIDGWAQFELSVPSSALSDTMNALSRLRFAHVASRTDSSQDVNDQYVSTTRQLADARALRTSLLKQLATATTQQQIDSLNGRIHDVEATIAQLEASLRSLNRAVNLSQISLTVNAVPQPVAPHSGGSSGFTLGKAAHDAGRVLTVAAGVALIALAVMVPLALLAALGLWIASALRRRRREHALDLA